ncbi:tail fiber protein [Escherichia coli]|nr:tail fiber protein [Escherichia coli]
MQLSSTTDSDDETKAATPKAVKAQWTKRTDAWRKRKR